MFLCGPMFDSMHIAHKMPPNALAAVAIRANAGASVEGDATGCSRYLRLCPCHLSGEVHGEGRLRTLDFGRRFINLLIILVLNNEWL